MGMATTNMLATAIAAKDKDRAKKIMAHAVFISFALGIALMITQSVFALKVLTFLSGSAVESIPHSLKYVKV